MSIFDKVMFWKKEDSFDFEHLADKEFSQSGAPVQDDLGIDEKSPFPEDMSFESRSASKNSLENAQFSQSVPRSSPFPNRPQQPPLGSRDMELISSKLDTIKAMLNSLEQRITQIEKAVGVEQKQRLW